MRDAVERCPNDGAILGYGIDWLGRLAAYCDVCGGRFKHSTIPKEVIIPPELISAATMVRRDVLLDRDDHAVLGALHAYPPGYTLAELVAVTKLGKPRVRQTLSRGKKAHLVAMAQRRVTGVRPQNVYYHTDHARPDTQRSAEEVAAVVLEFLQKVQHWRRAEDIARAIGTPSSVVFAALGILLKRHKVECARHMRDGRKLKEWRAG